jgi:hypothetical protein
MEISQHLSSGRRYHICFVRLKANGHKTDDVTRLAFPATESHLLARTTLLRTLVQHSQLTSHSLRSAVRGSILVARRAGR